VYNSLCIDLIFTHIYTHILTKHLHLSKPEVRLQLTHILLSELLLRISRADTRRNNNILSLLPVNRRNNALLVAHLQTVNDTQHFGGVPARGRRVHHAQTDLLGRVDDEDGANGESDSALFGEAVDVLLRDHVVEPGDVAVCVGDDGEFKGCVVDFVDVGDPFGVRGEVVGALRMELVTSWNRMFNNTVTHKADHLNVSLLEFAAELSESTQLSGAHGREVRRVREQNRPFSIEPLVEVDVSCGGFGLEVRSL
jgi:hypothetical protein